MTRTKTLKNIMLYLLMPEDTTETGYGDNRLQNTSLSRKLNWFGPLKIIFRVVIVIAGPLLLCTLLEIMRIFPLD